MGRRPKEVPVEGRHEGDIVVCDLCGESVKQSVNKSSFFIHFKGHQDQKVVMNCRFDILDSPDGNNRRSVCASCLKKMMLEVQESLRRAEG